MFGPKLLQMLEGGSRPFLTVRFEPGVVEPVARAHLSVNDPGTRESSCTTLLLDGVERPAPPPLDSVDASMADSHMPPELCVRISPGELVSAIGRFAGLRALACAMDDHTAATLRELEVEHITIEEAIAGLEPSAVRRLAFMGEFAASVGPKGSDPATYVSIALSAGIISAIGLRKFEL